MGLARSIRKNLRKKENGRSSKFMADKVKKAMKDLAKNKSRSATSGNRTNPKNAKTRSDAQHGQTEAKKTKGRPPKATR